MITKLAYNQLCLHFDLWSMLALLPAAAPTNPSASPTCSLSSSAAGSTQGLLVAVGLPLKLSTTSASGSPSDSVVSPEQCSSQEEAEENPPLVVSLASHSSSPGQWALTWARAALSPPSRRPELWQTLQRHSKACFRFLISFFPPWSCTAFKCSSTSVPVTPTSSLLQPRSLHLADSSRDTPGQTTSVLP